MRSRRSSSIPTVVAIVAVVAAACTPGGDDAGSGSTTTIEAPSLTGDTTTTSVPTTTLATTTTMVAREDTPVFVEDACRFPVPDGHRVDCGWLVVPERRDDPDDPDTVRLHVARFHSTAADPPPDPIVYLEGGPGGEALATVPITFETRFAPLLADRDLIVFDQRGVGFSDPTLGCPELIDMQWELLDEELPTDEVELNLLFAYHQCRTRLIEDGVDLSAYTTAAGAADVADLRTALGYDEWNLLGVSYGTRLALAVLRDHPDGVRSVVLDSVYPHDVDLVIETPRNARRAFDVLFAACEANAACAAAHPELEQTLVGLMEQLDAEPLDARIEDTISGRRSDLRVDGASLGLVLFQALYATPVIPLLPGLIEQVAAGDTARFSALAGSFLSNAEFVSAGMSASVLCRDEVSFSSPTAAEGALADLPVLGRLFESTPAFGPFAFEVCDLWQAGAAGPVENEPVSSDVPALVLAGEFDPITPPAWGELVADRLRAAFFVGFPEYGHAVTSIPGCPMVVMLEFLDEPSSPPDAACLDDRGPPEFEVLGEGAETIFMLPFSESILGTEVTGLAPTGWEPEELGLRLRMLDPLDRTSILQQAGSGGDPDFLVAAMATEIGLGVDPVPDTTIETADGRIWSHYRGMLLGMTVDFAVAESGEFVYVVLLNSLPPERDLLFDEVFLPALEALEAE